MKNEGNTAKLVPGGSICVAPLPPPARPRHSLLAARAGKPFLAEAGTWTDAFTSSAALGFANSCKLTWDVVPCCVVFVCLFVLINLSDSVCLGSPADMHIYHVRCNCPRWDTAIHTQLKNITFKKKKQIRLIFNNHCIWTKFFLKFFKMKTSKLFLRQTGNAHHFFFCNSPESRRNLAMAEATWRSNLLTQTRR